MALENLFIRTQNSISGKVGNEQLTIQLDATIKEDHDSSISITKNPIEFGADISDHAIIEPVKLTLDVQVSDTPLGTQAVGQLIESATNFFGTSTSENVTRSVAAFQDLQRLQREREPLVIQTSLIEYQDMLITNITTVRDKNTSRVIRAVLSLEEVRIVETEVTTLSAEQLEIGQVRQQGSSAVDRGRQQPVTPESSVQTSLLQKARGLLGL